MPKTEKRATRKVAAVADTGAYMPEDYAAVTQRAQLSSIHLLSCAFRVHPEFSGDPAHDARRRKFSYGITFTEFAHDTEVGQAVGHFTWSVDVRSGRKKVVSIKATYAITYTNLESMKSGSVLAFVERVGRFATYPYFRSLVSQLSWESGAQLPIMPVISSTR